MVHRMVQNQSASNEMGEEGDEMDDMISRQQAIDALEREKTYSAVYKYGYTRADYFKQYNMGLTDGIKALNKLPSVQPQRWIPFETREPDAEEKEDHPEWEYVLCGNLPDDGQRILVNIKYKGHEAVQMDEYVDDGGICYLDSGYDIGTEATAWMPLPEPYAERRQDE